MTVSGTPLDVNPGTDWEMARFYVARLRGLLGHLQSDMLVMSRFRVYP